MYKVGDKVKIRQWDDMENEFGTDAVGDIATKVYFVRDMKKYCGMEATIEGRKGERYTLDFGEGSTIWDFSDDMFEKKATYKVGDKVRVKKFDERPRYWNFNGKMDYLMGKVVTVEGIGLSERLIVEGGWSIKPEDVETVEPVKNEQQNKFIFINREGNEVIAFDNTNKKAVAKCHPDDEFNFETGARIAFDRLIGNEPDQKEEPPKYYNGKIVITRCDMGLLSAMYERPFTVGKIYEIKDGKFTTDNGVVFPVKLPITSIEDLRDYFNCDTKTRKRKDADSFAPFPIEFVEVVE